MGKKFFSSAFQGGKSYEELKKELGEDLAPIVLQTVC